MSKPTQPAENLRPASQFFRGWIALGIGIGLLIAVAGVGWWQFAVSPAELLDAGLMSVENADLEGLERIQERLKRRGGTEELAVLEGARLVRAGRYLEALNALPPDLLAGRHRHHVMRIGGESLFRLGDFAKAELLLTRLTAESRREVQAHRILAAMYYDLGATALVFRELEAIQQLAPDDYRPYHLAALIHADEEEFDAAATSFRQALDRHPPQVIAEQLSLELARALVRNRQYQAALDELETQIESAERSTLEAECFWSLGDLPQALERVETVLQAHPGQVAALRLKARLLEQRGQLEGALEALEQVLQKEPYDVESRYLFVQLLGSRGRLEERDRQQAEYSRWKALHDRMVELNRTASEQPDAVAPRRELVTVCRELGRERLAEMWQRSAEYCEQRQRAAQTPEASVDPAQTPDSR